MKGFNEIPVDQYHEIINLKKRINDIDEKISNLNSCNTDYSSEIQEAEKRLMDLKIKLVLEETTQNEINKQQHFLNELFSKQQNVANQFSDENEVLTSAKKTLESRLENEMQKAKENNLQRLTEYVEQLTTDNKSKMEEIISIVKEITECKIEIERHKGIKSIFYDRVYTQIPMALALIHVATKLQTAEGDYDIVSKGSLIKSFYDSI